MLLISTLGRVIRSVLKSAEHARAIRDLRAMSDRDLKDIGVSRAEIEAVVTGRQASDLAARAPVGDAVRANNRFGIGRTATADA